MKLHGTFLENCIKLSLLSLIVLLSACSSAPKKVEQALPEWVTFPPQNEQFIYGVGSAEIVPDINSSFDLATKRANLDIANQLKVTIQSVNFENSQVYRFDTQQEQVMQSLSQFIRVETNPITLESTETDQRFVHTHYVYVLQRLDRQNLIQQLKSKIASVDKNILNINNTIQYDRLLTEQWSLLLPALSLLSERRKLNESLSLYSKGEVIQRPQYVLKVQAKTAQLIRDFRIAIDKDGFADELSQEVGSVLSKKGLTPSLVSYASSNLALSLKPSYEYKTQKQRHYVFINVNASLMNNDQITLATWSSSARGISSSQEQATIMANQEVAENLVEKIFLWLTGQE
ncbi:LPP20 family lipoprotein [Marinomonas sp. 2405UD68-3]|uniref:LPP20 family lipoprotein n=1 Tax=Marinomonas sp. 2405UD68-3 TaxID=3391835 RepID=UPI0039C9750E